MYAKLLGLLLLNIFISIGIISAVHADFYVIPVIKKIKNITTVAKSGGDFVDPIQAVNSITDANETNRYIIKISEGIYDLNETLIMKPYVDIVGVGKNKTKLRGEISGDTVNANTATLISCANHSLLSDLSVENAPLGNSDYAVAVHVYNKSSVTLRNLNVTLNRTAGSYSMAVRASNTDMSILDSNISATGSDEIQAVSLQFSSVSITNSTVTATGGTHAYGIHKDNFPLTIVKSDIFANNASVDNTAIYIGSGANIAAALISSSHVEANSGADTAIVGNDGYITILNSEILGISGSHKTCIDSTGVGGLALDENCTVP